MAKRTLKDKPLTVLYYKSDHQMIADIKARLNIRTTADVLRNALKESHDKLFAGAV